MTEVSLHGIHASCRPAKCATTVSGRFCCLSQEVARIAPSRVSEPWGSGSHNGLSHGRSRVGVRATAIWQDRRRR